MQREAAIISCMKSCEAIAGFELLSVCLSVSRGNKGEGENGHLPP